MFDDQIENWDDEYLRMLGLITVNFAGLESKLSSFIAQLMIKARGLNRLSRDEFSIASGHDDHLRNVLL